MSDSRSSLDSEPSTMTGLILLNRFPLTLRLNVWFGSLGKNESRKSRGGMGPIEKPRVSFAAPFCKKAESFLVLEFFVEAFVVTLMKEMDSGAAVGGSMV